MGSVIELGQLIDHHKLAVLEDLLVQEPAAVSEHVGTKVLPDDNWEGSGGRGRVGARKAMMPATSLGAVGERRGTGREAGTEPQSPGSPPLATVQRNVTTV
jgi:hypothetical protein